MIRYFILGDSAFAGTDFILKPMTAGQTLRVQGANYSQKYNKLQSSARMFIEQAWGMVVNRFRIFKATSEIKGVDWIERFGSLILAGLILHNICVHVRDQEARRTSFELDEQDLNEINALPKGKESWLRLQTITQSRIITHSLSTIRTLMTY